MSAVDTLTLAASKSKRLNTTSISTPQTVKSTISAKQPALHPVVTWLGHTPEAMNLKQAVTGHTFAA